MFRVNIYVPGNGRKKRRAINEYDAPPDDM